MFSMGVGRPGTCTHETTTKHEKIDNEGILKALLELQRLKKLWTKIILQDVDTKL